MGLAHVFQKLDLIFNSPILSSVSVSIILSSDDFPSFFFFSPFLPVSPSFSFFLSLSLFFAVYSPPFLSKNLKSFPSFFLVFHDFQLQNTEHKNQLIPSGMCALSLLAPLLLFTKAKILVAQSCPTLCHPMDCSPPVSSVCGILQEIILEQVTIPTPQIFLTQGSNPDHLHCLQILYHLSHQGSPLFLIP